MDTDREEEGDPLSAPEGDPLSATPTRATIRGLQGQLGEQQEPGVGRAGSGRRPGLLVRPLAVQPWSNSCA